MRIPARIATKMLLWLHERIVSERAPDFIVGSENPDGAYLERWWLIPRNRLFNIYLHHFLRDDDPRALHDHPWASISILLSGKLIEHTVAYGGVRGLQVLQKGDVKYRPARFAHRLELEKYQLPFGRPTSKHAWTIFITGPVIRKWGFHCPDAGWVSWDKFTQPGKPGETGSGCNP